MSLITRLAGLLGLVASLGFAENWSGTLVDAKCYAAEQQNTRAALPNAGRDIGGEIRYCSPTAKTTSFAIVQQDGVSVTLDSQGNAQAAALVRNSGKKRPLLVDAAGEKAQNTIKVTNLSLSAKQAK